LYAFSADAAAELIFLIERQPVHNSVFDADPAFTT